MPIGERSKPAPFAWVLLRHPAHALAAGLHLRIRTPAAFGFSVKPARFSAWRACRGDLTPECPTSK
jgi:hypothetical protein